MSQTVRPRRSALYLPGSSSKALAKVRTLPADVVIIDLEDSVAPELKVAARAAAVDAVQQGGFGYREIVVRINGLGTPWGVEDLRAVAGLAIDAVLVPKVSSAAELSVCNAVLDTAHGAASLWAMIETCAAVFRLGEIAAAAQHTRLAALVLGTNDLAREMQARLMPDRLPLLPVLTLAVAAARANALAVIDGVCNEFTDLAVFRAEAQQGRVFGFDGKTLIHPAQIEPCNAIFTPAAAELAWADSVITAFALPENAAKGAINVAGKMVELLHLEQARRIRAMAGRIRAVGV
jgi:citrate lyase subunit beta / citryl-CoA lyase